MNSGAKLRLGRIPREIKGHMVDFGALLRKALSYEFAVLQFLYGHCGAVASFCIGAASGKLRCVLRGNAGTWHS